MRIQSVLILNIYICNHAFSTNSNMAASPEREPSVSMQLLAQWCTVKRASSDDAYFSEKWESYMNPSWHERIF
jgi:hypothetical protein